MARLTIALVVLFLMVPYGAADAQPAAKLWRIGYLDQQSAGNPYFEAFRQGLRELGWIEGQNITVDARFAEGRTDRLPALATELVRTKVDVIATFSTPAALAAKQATTAVPIVFGAVADPVGNKIVSSLAHPGGNITGWTHIGLELRAKYLELLKEAVPGATRFGVLWNPTNQVHKPSLRVIEDAAARLKVQLHLVGIQDPSEFEGAFTALGRKGAQALVVFPDGMFLTHTPLIIRLAARNRLPAMYGVREYAEVGGMMAYGTNLVDMYRQLGASFVDKILKGAKPADLPVAQPTKFELLINLKAAKTLGLTIPPSLLVRADQIIE
jgi:putative ABC transport system substrate-binding protein